MELEKSEQGGSVTLNTLQRAAEALGCRLVYVLVPERPLADVVAERAKLVAERQSKAIEHTMRLEDQAVKDKEPRARFGTGDRGFAERPSRLWDEE